MNKPLKFQNIFSPGPRLGLVRNAVGQTFQVPPGWGLLEPGDATLTRRTKASGEHWVVQETKGRRTYSQGVWAPKTVIAKLRQERIAEQSIPAYAKKKVAASGRRDKVQKVYVESFYGAVVGFLAFHPNHEPLARLFAQAVTNHATPVGSGTVARTKRISVEKRAEAAVIAWMRHQTTGYESMHIPRTKGNRREIRRLLAQKSKEILAKYRQGLLLAVECPLYQAVWKSATTEPIGGVPLWPSDSKPPFPVENNSQSSR